VAFGTTAGNDTIVASNGALTANDTINFGAGSDTINASGAAQTLDLDMITGLDSVVMAGTSNADTSTVQFDSIGAATVQTITVDGSAMSGTNDTLKVDTNVTNTGGTSFNITGSGGNDSLEGGASADTIVGGTGNDTVSSGAGNDVISDTSGNTNVSGGAGNNHVTTGDGTDTIATTTGTDTVLAGGGNDTITTGAGNDTIEGGAGNDTIDAGTGLDTVSGGAGADEFVVATESSKFIYTTITDLELGAGGDTISGFSTGANAAAETFNTTAVTLGGGATFADYLDEAAKTGGTEGELSWFTFNGNTYIVQDNSTNTTFTAGTDIVVEITGEKDLSGMTVGDGELGP
jgi:Ca2+-binding RTX toxin-like protein